jgi:hypothetical protein
MVKFLPVILAFFVAYPTIIAAADSQTSFAPSDDNAECAEGQKPVTLANGDPGCESISVTVHCLGGEPRKYLDSTVCSHHYYFSASSSLTTASNTEPGLREMLPSQKRPAPFRPANQRERGRSKCSVALSIGI